MTTTHNNKKMNKNEKLMWRNALPSPHVNFSVLIAVKLFFLSNLVCKWVKIAKITQMNATPPKESI